MTAGAGFAAKVVALAAKDARVEVRARHTLVPMVVFALAVAVVLGFTLPDPTRVGGGVVAGWFWITILFAGLIGFARTFEVERDDGALDVLLLAPLDRSGLFAAKALANLCAVVVVETVLLPVFGVLFGLELRGRWALLASVVLLADIGFASLGTLVSALSAQTRSRELLLPVVALPLLVPLFIAAVELSGDLLTGRPLEEVAARGWVAILVTLDVVATTLGALTFEYAVD
jgi:heme exporter protein B